MNPKWWCKPGHWLVLGLLLVMSCSSGDGEGDAKGGKGSTTRAAASGTTVATSGVEAAPEAPPEVIRHADDWPLPNRDYANSRAVFDGPIDSSTVDRLEEAWRYEMPGEGMFGNAATNPVVVGDTVYVGDLTTVVHAVDRETGQKRWTAGEFGSIFGPTGATAGWGKVFATKAGGDGRGSLVVAYDAESGDELWATDIAGNGGIVNIHPTVYDGLVFASTSGFGEGTRGTISALDQETGEVVWVFDTIESDDLWGHPDLNSGGGSWYPPAIDPESGVAYFGVGNPYPFPGAPGYPNGTSRPGDNRWTESTVALDLATGELRWGFQPYPHDLWDRDQMVAALTDVEGRRIVVSTGKGGVVFGLDAATGEELWSVVVGRHDNDDLTEIEGPIEVLPGAQGGVLTPIAVAGDVAYAAVVNAPTSYAGPEESSSGFTTRLGALPSNLVAIDLTKGQILWDVTVDGDALGGMTVVNDLVFTATFGGRIVALDRATGEEVWSLQADGGINGWPAVAGDLIIWPVGVGDPAHLLALRLG